MFKKLKKKIEDGDVASPDRSPFGFSSPSTRMAVPGIPVRLPSETETPQESEGNNSSVQQIEGGNTERRAERIDENAQVPLDGKGRITGVEPVANDVPKTGALSTGTGVDPTVPDGTSVEKTTTKASTGWSSLGVKAQGLTAMIRGDSSVQQQLLELERQKEKLEAALERQQDLMVQRLKEQNDLHQREVEAEREKTITQVAASKEKELMEAKDLISNLKSSVSKLKLELDESTSAQGALRQQCTELKAAHSTMGQALREREEECRRLQLQCSLLQGQGSQGTREGEENRHRGPEEEGQTVDDRTVAPTSEAKEESTPGAVLEESPPAAILEVKERDIQWTQQDSIAASVNEADHQLNGAEVCNLLDANQRMQEELMEKDQAIKVLQQKMADLKKTLQKELMQRSHSTAPVHWESPHNPPNRSVSIPAPPSQQQEPDVSYQYLKHVVLRYMCSEGEEARYLVKAISTLLNFSKSEEKRIKEYMDYKVSWFGTKPPPIVPSSNRRNPFPQT